MSWRDDLLPGSFRGIPFVMRSAGGEFGRRVSLHEYPLQDKPFAEDLGKKARKLNVEAILIGDDYDVQRDAMIDAIEKPGTGELVHPRFGNMMVTVIQFRVRETSREGGMATLTMEFVESGDLVFPASASDTSAQVDDAADAATEVALDDFGNSFSVDKQPGWVGAAAIEQLTGLVDDIRNINGQINTALEPLSIASQQFDAFGDQLATLILAPRTLGSLIASTINSVVSVGTDIRAALSGYEQLGDFGLTAKPIPSTTPSRSAQAANQAAVQNLVKQSAAISAAKAASQLNFDSYNEAIAVRSARVAELDAIALDASFDLFNQVSALRAAVVNDITTRGGDLGRVIQHTPIATLPAVLIAYQLYGQASRDADLILRNRIRHPLFVGGGDALEVLSA